MPSHFGKNLKYNTSKKKPVIDNITFDSKLEAEFYLFMKSYPEIRILEFHPRFLLQDKYRTKDGRNIKAIEYVSDFRIDVGGDVYLVDAKGQETTDFKLKRKIFEKRYPDEVLLVLKTTKELKLAIF